MTTPAAASLLPLPHLLPGDVHRVKLAAATVSDGMVSMEDAMHQLMREGMARGQQVERALWQLAATSDEIEGACVDHALAGQWIAVSERLPECGEPVLLFRPQAEEFNDPIFTVRQRRKFGPGPFQFDCIAVPTHWMPLPEGPKS